MSTTPTPPSGNPGDPHQGAWSQYSAGPTGEAGHDPYAARPYTAGVPIDPGYPPALSYPQPHPGQGPLPGQGFPEQYGSNPYGPTTFPPPGYPPAGYGQGPYGPAGYGPRPQNGLGTAGMVLGIIGLVFFWNPVLCVILSVLAVIFGGVGLSRARQGTATNRGTAMAGLVMGIVGLGLLLLLIVTVGTGLGLFR